MALAIQRISHERPPTHWSALRWSRCTEDELLIDLSEWSQVTGLVHGLPPHSAFTSGLWSFLESVPFGELRSSSPTRRIQHVLACASAALERILEGSRHALLAPGISVRFSTHLRSRSDAPRLTTHRMHVESMNGDLFVTVGLDRDFSAHPIELLPLDERIAAPCGSIRRR